MRAWTARHGAVGSGAGAGKITVPTATSALWRAAATLKRTRRRGKGLPTVWFITDPNRTPDPVAVAARLPRGAGVIYRHFGRPGAETTALRLAAVARGRGLVLLVGQDADLAARIGAAGVHLPEREIGKARRLSAHNPGWIITAAAHSPRAIRRAEAGGLDAVLASTVFPSRSPSSGAPLGAMRLARLAREARLPVYALGGVNEKTARRLIGTGVAGFAAVEGLTS